MAPSGLSSNWKILQQRLQNSTTSTDSTDTPPKRKTTVTEDARKSVQKIRPGSNNKVTKNRDSKFKARKMPGTAITSTTATKNSLSSWAEDNDIPVADIARAYNLSTTTPQSTKTSAEAVAISEADPSRTEVGKYVAIDCEMVGVGGAENERNALARVSIVNFHGHLVMDTFVKPKEPVTDWRTWISGVSPANMKTAITFEEAQKKVSDSLQDRILVGHAVHHDLEALMLSHPKRDIRDTSRHPAFRKMSQGRTPGLKKLTKEILGYEIQGGEHSSIEDARACMSLYRLQKDSFESLHAAKYPGHANKQRGKGAGVKKKKKKA
ncbi:ribonuclease H-like domain-containing protein [Morchella snyderi]|nr:ribonuclease H-like domain-containing protein [Morchella snyderi]